MTGLRKPTEDALRQILERQLSSQPTYSETGATAGEMPSGFHHDEFAFELGRGRDLFERCSQFLDNWRLQEAMGFSLYPPESVVETGNTVLLSLRVMGLAMIASCRVIYTVREENRHGFAYGTLPAHPECGEEYFGVRMDDDVVRFELRAFSRAHSPLARLGGPVTRAAQLAAMKRYGNKMKQFANELR